MTGPVVQPSVFARYRKAILAAIGVIVTIASTLLAQNLLSGSAKQWATIAVAVGAALLLPGGVAAISNAPKASKPPAGPPMPGPQEMVRWAMDYIESRFGKPGTRNTYDAGGILPSVPTVAVAPAEGVTVTYPTLSSRGLGRKVNHDPASRQYALPEPDETAVLATVNWMRRVPIFDQGQVGSCTGNAAAGWEATDNASRQGQAALPDGTAVDEKLALSIYSAAETIDGDGPYPPNDNGSSGLSVAKVLKTRGLCTTYLHAFTAAAAYAALAKGPGFAGTTWYNSMLDTAPDGYIKVDKSSGVAGGHEYVIKGIEVVNGAVTKVWMDNSWGSSWGVSGSGYFTDAEFKALLADNGDFTQPAPAVVPSPTPPAPGPTPTPAPPTPAPSTDSFLVAVATYPRLYSELVRLAAEKKMSIDDYAAWRLAGDTRTR